MRRTREEDKEKLGIRKDEKRKSTQEKNRKIEKEYQRNAKKGRTWKNWGETRLERAGEGVEGCGKGKDDILRLEMVSSGREFRHNQYLT